MDLVPQSEYDWAESVSAAPVGLSGAYSYDSWTKDITVPKDKSVIVSSGVYFFNQLKLEQGAGVIVAPGASVTIYMTGDFLVGQNSTINDGGKPKDLAVYSKGEHFQLGQGNIFYGVFYGPNVAFVAGQSSIMYGAIVAQTLQMGQNDCFHYDRGLAKFSKDGSGVVSTVAWREL